MKKNVCLILFFLSLSICFGLNPRPLHISEIFESVDEKMLEGLSNEERTLLFSCLSRMKQNLTTLCEENKEDEV